MPTELTDGEDTRKCELAYEIALAVTSLAAAAATVVLACLAANLAYEGE